MYICKNKRQHACAGESRNVKSWLWLKENLLVVYSLRNLQSAFNKAELETRWSHFTVDCRIETDIDVSRSFGRAAGASVI
jgi:hypothetical protein